MKNRHGFGLRALALALSLGMICALFSGCSLLCMVRGHQYQYNGNTAQCVTCGEICEHSFRYQGENALCTICGLTCRHTFAAEDTVICVCCSRNCTDLRLRQFVEETPFALSENYAKTGLFSWDLLGDYVFWAHMGEASGIRPEDSRELSYVQTVAALAEIPEALALYSWALCSTSKADESLSLYAEAVNSLTPEEAGKGFETAAVDLRRAGSGFEEIRDLAKGFAGSLCPGNPELASAGALAASIQSGLEAAAKALEEGELVEFLTVSAALREDVNALEGLLEQGLSCKEQVFSYLTPIADFEF